MKFLKLFGVILVVPFLLTACGEDDDVRTNIEVRKPAGPLSVTVGDGQNSPQKPFYVWSNINDSNDTTALTLSVARVTPTASNPWELTSIGAGETIQSGVEHGVVPPGASEQQNDELALSFNVWYKLTIDKFDDLLDSSMEFQIIP